MPLWTSSRHGDENWPSHSERRRDGSTKIKAKKPTVTYVRLIEEGFTRRRHRLKGGSVTSGYSRDRESSYSRGTSFTGSTFSSSSSRTLPIRNFRPPVPSPPISADVVTLDFPSSSTCDSSESVVGGSDTESDRHSRRSSGSSSTASNGSRRSITLDDYSTYRPKRRSPSPASSTASSRSKTFPLGFCSNASSISIASTSSSKSSLPHPTEPSPPPSPVFPRPPASPASSVADSSATSMSRSTMSKPSLSVNVVTCEPPPSIVGSDVGTSHTSHTYTTHDSGYSVPSATTTPHKPIALCRTWSRPQPMPVLQPIQTDVSAYQVGYSPYVPYPAYGTWASSTFSPAQSKSSRVRWADRTPRSPWVITRTPKTPKTPRTPRLARAPRGVRVKTHRREKPRIIQGPRTPRTPRTSQKYSTPFDSSRYAPEVITASPSGGSGRGRPPSPTGSYVRTESGSRERQRQRRAALAARKAEASANSVALEAAEAAEARRTRIRRPPPQIVISNSGSSTSGSSISSRRSHRPLTPVRIVAPQLPQIRKRKSTLALSRHRTEPIRSPIVDDHRPPREPRRKSATAGLEKDPRVVRADDQTWGDYLMGGGGVEDTRSARPSEASRSRKSTSRNGLSPFGGYYESEAPRRSSTPTTRSMRPLDDILAYLRPRESGNDRDVPRPRRTTASVAPRVAAARREASRWSEPVSEKMSGPRSRSRSQSRM